MTSLVWVDLLVGLSFFSPVWQKLEEENRDFFKAYYVRLMLMNQITAFNKLLEQQYEIMTKDHPSGMPSVPPAAPNGSNSNTCKFLFSAAIHLHYLT
jgi:hypothetical protein